MLELVTNNVGNYVVQTGRLVRRNVHRISLFMILYKGNRYGCHLSYALSQSFSIP